MSIDFVCELSEGDREIDEWFQNRGNPFQNRGKRPSTLNPSLYSDVKKWLERMGITSAEVDLVRGEDGLFCRGSTRVPLKVISDTDTFVIKSYDEYNTQRERSILEVVQGKIAPRVIHFGDEFYAEELVDFSEYPSLSSFAKFCGVDSFGMGVYLKIGAKIHARLAKLGLNYHHNHWLGEFHIGSPGNYLVTDFGTSTFFYTPKQYQTSKDREKELFERLRALGSSSWINDEKLINEFKEYGKDGGAIQGFGSNLEDIQKEGLEGFLHKLLPDSEDKQELLEHLMRLNDTVLIANLGHVLECAEEAIKLYFENQRPDRRHISGHDYVAIYRDAFRGAFFRAYLS